MSRTLGALLALTALGAGAAPAPLPAPTPAPPPAATDAACAGAAWDHERALFRQAPQVLAAGTAPGKLPALKPEHLYELNLSAQPQVTFAIAPAKKKEVPGARAGLAGLTLERAGLYRISLSAPVWIDVIAGGAPIESRNHQGRHGCDAPQKIVEFALPAATALTLQFSAATTASVDVAVTLAPAPVPAPQVTPH